MATFRQAWSGARYAALAELGRLLGAGCSHDTLADARAFEEIVGRKPTHEEIEEGNLREHAQALVVA